MKRRQNRILRVTILTSLTVAAAISITRIKFNASPEPAAPNHPYFHSIRENRSKFLSADYIVVTIDHPDIFSPEAIDTIHKVSADLDRMPEVAGVLSITTLMDVENTLESRLVLDVTRPIDEEAISRLTNYLSKHEFIRELTIAADHNGAAVLVFAAEQDAPSEFAKAVLGYTDANGIDSSRVYGRPVLIHYATEDNKRDSALLLGLALVFVFILEWIVTKEPLLALALWWSAVVSVIWTIVIFIVFAIPMQVETIVIPVTVLALATSYGIHLHRYHANHPEESFDTNVRHARPIICVAGLTTLLGFASLLISRVPILRTVGLISAAGVAISVGSALYYLVPIYSAAIRRCSPRPSVFGIRPTKRLTIFTILIILLAGIGAGRIYINPQFVSVFRKRSDAAKAIAHFERNYFAGDTVELYLDTQSEYGLVSIENYASMTEIESRLESDELIAGVYSHIDIINWFNRGPPENDAQIGESLELLSGGASGIDIGTFVDVDYQSTRLLIRPQPSSNGFRAFGEEIQRLELKIESIVLESEFEGAWIVGGTSPYIRRINSLFARGQILGLIFFLATVFVVALLMMKELRLAAIAVFPPLCAAAVYAGTVGWSGQPYSIATGVGLAVVLGISVDDVMYFLLYMRHLRKKSQRIALTASITNAGPAIVETTTVLVAGVSVLFASRFASLALTGAFTIAGLITPTLVTLAIVPHMIGSIAGRRGINKS